MAGSRGDVSRALGGLALDCQRQGDIDAMGRVMDLKSEDRSLTPSTASYPYGASNSDKLLKFSRP